MSSEASEPPLRPADLGPPIIPGEAVPLDAPRSQWAQRAVKIAAIGLGGLGIHKGFNSDLPVLGNLSEGTGDLSEISEVAIMSGTLAVGALRSQIGQGIRSVGRYKSSRDLDKLDKKIDEKVTETLDTPYSVESIRTGKSRVRQGTGLVVSKKEARKQRKLVNARDKGTRLMNETLGDRRHIGQASGRTMTIHDRHSKTGEILQTREIKVTDSDLGTEAHTARLDSIPRTQSERDMHQRAVNRLHHEQHRAHALWERATADILETPRREIEALEGVREQMEERTARRGGWVPRIEDRPTKLGRTYGTTKRLAKTAREVASKTLTPVKKAWRFIRD